MDVEVNTSGPLFDGRAARALARASAEASEDGANYYRGLVLDDLARVLQHPTGYYESNIVTDQVTEDTYRVWDHDIVYGPWLEGVGSRNFPATRFRGYSQWRRMVPFLKARIPLITREAVDRHMNEVR